jgi:alkanesulfonate monooxygenase SsuD/methylene tetrahydromethanopterin reductase-like flavin-dependent oxidoreductase (luciferase family)
LGKLKFGVFLPFYAFQTKTPNEYYELLKTIVLECERLDYDSIWLDDHLMYNNWSILEPWITLSALSSLTRKIRLGTMVTCIAHRDPALLAKTSATLDVLSKGRLEFGVGAGCQEAEHLAYGYGFPKPSVRIENLGEALEVITRLWTQKIANYQGKHYILKDAVCEPKPLQKPHPPITVGGGGEKQTMKITAKYANRFDWGSLSSADEYKRKLEFLQEQCNAIGRDYGEIELSCWPGGQVLIAQNQKRVEEMISIHKPESLPMDEFKKGNLSGTPNECRDQLQIYVDLGVTYFMLYFADLPSIDGLKLFSEEVIKKI